MISFKTTMCHRLNLIHAIDQHYIFEFLEFLHKILCCFASGENYIYNAVHVPCIHVPCTILADLSDCYEQKNLAKL